MNSKEFVDRLNTGAVRVKYHPRGGRARSLNVTLNEIFFKEDSRTGERSPRSRYNKVTNALSKRIVVWDIEAKGWRVLNFKSIRRVANRDTKDGVIFDRRSLG